MLKAPAAEIASARGTVPVHVRHELWEDPPAPVIRTVLTIPDKPRRWLRFESFVNVGDDQQRADFATLAHQEQLLLLFYDETLQHRLFKVVPTRPDKTAQELLETANALRTRIPAEPYDFDRRRRR